MNYSGPTATNRGIAVLFVSRVTRYFLSAGLLAAVSFAGHSAAVAGETHRVRIDAEVVTGAGPIRDGVEYTIESLDGDYRQTTTSEPVGPIQLDLVAGRYAVTAVYETAVVRDHIVVDGIDDYLTINLNAGWVELDLIHGVGRAVRGETVWMVESYGRMANGKRKQMHEASSTEPLRLALPAGWFVVTAQHGGVATKHTIEVTAGVTYTYDIVKKQVAQAKKNCGQGTQVAQTC